MATVKVNGVETQSRYNPTDEQKKKAQEYANAMLTGKGQSNYGYLSPGQAVNAVTNASNPIATSGGGSSGGSSNSYNAYQAYFDEQNRLLQEQQELKRRQREANMNATIDANNSAAKKSLTDAYVSNMMEQKNLPQQLRAVGISGGGAETTVTDINNTYENNRGNIKSDRDNNNAVARLAYQQGVDGDYGDYLTSAYELKGSQATQAAKSTQAAKATPSGTNYGNQQVQVGNEKVSLSKLVNYYRQNGVSDDDIEKYLNQIGIN